METDLRNMMLDACHALRKELAGTDGTPSLLQTAVDAERVFTALSHSPWTPARELAEGLGVDQDRMLLAYKCMQRAEGMMERLSQGVHSDYFNVVRHYFNTPFYTLVFFVGTTCPSRCVFCPNVSVNSDGSRSLTNYGDGMTPMESGAIDAMFLELDRLKTAGIGLLVKISGGLEPMTDVKTLTHIARRAGELSVPVKLFTNGILLNTDQRRRAALLTRDIRISLSTADAGQYEVINFGERRPRHRMRLDHLKENLKALVRLRDRTGSATQIGFNSIIMPTNCDQVLPLMNMARDLGVDYIDFKPDYFGSVDTKEQKTIMDAVAMATDLCKQSDWKSLYIHFAGAIQRDHLYWKSWEGQCDAVKQAKYKMFVTPFGHLSPIHYGAFPHSDIEPEAELARWDVGRTNGVKRFLDVLASPDPIPAVPWSCLNPFELMLSLEIEREALDKAWGIPVSCSPYHTSRRHELPVELVEAWRRGGVHAL